MLRYIFAGLVILGLQNNAAYGQTYPTTTAAGWTIEQLNTPGQCRAFMHFGDRTRLMLIDAGDFVVSVWNPDWKLTPDHSKVTYQFLKSDGSVEDTVTPIRTSVSTDKDSLISLIPKTSRSTFIADLATSPKLYVFSAENKISGLILSGFDVAVREYFKCLLYPELSAANKPPAPAASNLAIITAAQNKLKTHLANRILRDSQYTDDADRITGISFPDKCIMTVTITSPGGGSGPLQFDFSKMNGYQGDEKGLVFDYKNGQKYIDLPDLEESLFVEEALDDVFGDCGA